MKKGIRSIIAGMSLLLLASCGQTDKNSGTFVDNTLTPIEIPSGTPSADISYVPNLHPTEGQTDIPFVTQRITPALSPEPTPGLTTGETPVLEPSLKPMITGQPAPTMSLTPSTEPTSEPIVSVTPALEPSVEPTITEQPILIPTMEPTLEPTASATPSPEPTLKPTATEPPTPTVTPSPIPTPTINPDPLITNGWQKMISVDEKYKIVFPELYKESIVTKTDNELEISYSCAENEDIALTIGYTMQQKREYFVYEILSVSGSIIEERPAEKRTTCVWQLGNKKYLATFIDEEYARDLVGSSFGNEEKIPGVMHVVFSYPADKSDIYETEQYCFYIANNGEE